MGESYNPCTDPPPILKAECFQGRTAEHLTFERAFEIIRWISRATSPHGSGGLSIFLGTVKGRAEGHRVERLIYESYEPYASQALDSIAKSFSSDKEVLSLIIVQSIGELRPGDPTILVASSATSRKKAFDSAKEALERAKFEPPVFKLEVREDGEYWISGDGKRYRRENK
ncbi:MAG: molybdenum cofactor biosynthesis protein MoaE [Fervidicoccaceae archaeon]